ncbi:hypothetical protein [Halalkalibacter urbisdiaboli]|nr:hypothetical protein [Halalkalibacter urbisdiaboli]
MDYHVAELDNQELEKLRLLEQQLGVVLIAYSGDEKGNEEHPNHS